MTAEWTTVFAGPIWEVQFLQARLDEGGHTTFVPSNNLKVLDPFATGANSLDAELQVPMSQYDAARTLVETVQREKRERRERIERGEDFGGEDSAWSSREVRDAHRMGQRVRWSMWCVITAPIGLYYGARYLAFARRLDDRPPQHGFTLFSMGLCLVLTSLYITVVLQQLSVL